MLDLFNDIIKKNYATQFTNTFGERKGKLMMQATAGRCAFMPPCALNAYLTLCSV